MKTKEKAVKANADSGEKAAAKKKTFTKKEMIIFADIKRFSEWLQVDAEMRKRLNKNKPPTEAQLEVLKEIGITVDIEKLEFLWKYPAESTEYIMLLSMGKEENIKDKAKEAAEKYPHLQLWGEHVKGRSNFAFMKKLMKLPKSANERYDAWLRRRVAAAKSELGYFAYRLSYPSFAFELTSGCSVGCWFCSFAAHKLSGTLDYPKRKNEVLSIVRQCGEIFGNAAIKRSLPYYRTEPHDNPYYVDFIKDFEKQTGTVLCTATAVCDDMQWIRDLRAYYQQREDGTKYNWPRLSILSKGALGNIYKEFTPYELIDTELLIQVKDHERKKVTGGRILKEQNGIKEKTAEDFSGDREKLMLSVARGTIACVAGFNINLVTNEIMVFSPCYTSEKWPHGFREFGTVKYTDENDFSEQAARARAIR